MITSKDSTVRIKNGAIQFSFFDSGDIQLATYNNIMINQWIANVIDGSMNNIYLRFHKDKQIEVIPLLGVKSNSTFHYSDNQVLWKGSYKEVNYQVIFTLTEDGIWFWDVQMEGSDVEIDVIYTQDLGLADQGAVRNNEAYISQYIDHVVFEDERRGYVLCSRQNQQQSTGFPYLQQGSLSKIVGYSTDGFQFFGLTYKETNKPEALSKANLPNEVYQYEFGFTALQTEKVKLNGKSQFVFYGLFKPNHEEAITALEFEKEILEAWKIAKKRNYGNFTPLKRVEISPVFGEPLQSQTFKLEEINKLFPKRIHEEWDGEQLLSFFTETHEHVVLKEKEILVERPHGIILMSGNNVENIEEVITTTSYMYGVFNSQVTVGNTSFNKFLSNTRNPLNIHKISGQRIYVNLNGKYRLFAMPSMFEMGFNYARWYYKLDNETFIITNYTSVNTPEIHLHVQSLSGKTYQYLVTNQVIMNGNENEAPVEMEMNDHIIICKAGESSVNKNIYPDLTYRLRITGADFTLADEKIMVKTLVPNSTSLMIVELKDTADWQMTIQGNLYGQPFPFTDCQEVEEIEQYRQFLKETMNDFHLTFRHGTTETLEKFNTIAWWYTHNMLVHYSVPHGLEQYSGAAWGTRDVCQGPVEYFMATQNYSIIRNILLRLYSHQYIEDGNWPQWFMFDRYYRIQAGESHGDIIIWPLKVLSEYLLATDDYTILEEKVPYTKRADLEFTEQTESLLEHAKKEIKYITDHFLHDTYLSSYGDGDWDDTLQPANAQLKQYMSSSWTVALTYQTIKQFAVAIEKIDRNNALELNSIAEGIKSDFQKFMLTSDSDIVPGFLYMENPRQPENMVHPTDTNTGIQYRLLPMTRGIISELFNVKQAKKHYQIIKDHLYFPDGVRLMNRPANYTGGVSKHFKRAEQSANFGREIGLLYVHAHIRFVESMAKLGESSEAWRGLEVINPVNIRKSVPNADYRQSNTYFSSSDGKFKTRYEAEEHFSKLRTGTVKVKGGWRIYSSGPGIYMNQLISNVLGIRFLSGDLIIDPVLPTFLNGLQFRFKVYGKPVTFIYHLNGNKVNSIKINGSQVQELERIENPYRVGGLKIPQKIVSQRLSNAHNIIEIFM